MLPAIQKWLSAFLTCAFAAMTVTAAAQAGSPSSSSALAVLPHLKTFELLEDAHGRLLALGAGFNPDARAFVMRTQPNGQPDRSFGTDGAIRWPYSTSLGWDMGAVRSDGDIVVAGTDRFGAIDEQGVVHVDLVDSSGHLVRSFGHGGDVALKQPACLRGPTGLALQGSEVMLALLRWCNFHASQSIILLRLRGNGTLDTSFGTDGMVTIGSTSTLAVPSSPVSSLPGGRIAVASSQRPGTLTLTELLNTGAPTPHFGSRGIVRTAVGPSGQFVEATELSVGKARILTVSGCSGEGPYLARFHAGGSPYRFWPASSVFTTNVEPLGGALASGCGYLTAAQNGDFVGAGHAVVWFRPNGLLDVRHPVGSLPNGALAASIIASNDGSVVVASQRGTTTYINSFR